MTLKYLVTAAEYVNGYTVCLQFHDGRVRVVDLESALNGEIFTPLKNIDYFRTFRLNPDLDTIVWDNGADFAPEFLYYHA